MNRALTIFLLSISLLLGLTNQQSIAFGAFDGGGPLIFGTNKLFVVPGDTVTFTIFLDGPASGEDELTISSTPGAFIDLPTSITPEAGVTSVTFTATAGLNLTSGVLVTVTDGVVTVPAPVLTFFSDLFPRI